MDYLRLCFVAPHPPIVVPEVGGRDATKVENTAKALGSLASEIESIAPETIVIMSPHTPLFADAFTVKTAPRLSGSFRMFGAPQVVIESEPDVELAKAIARVAADMGIPMEGSGAGPARQGSELDHGILVPLYFLARKTYPLVCLSLSLLDYRDHYRLGQAIRDAVESLERKAVFIASGDMSHRLIPGAPAGYSPRGEEFDREVVDIMKSADYARLFRLDPVMVEDAGECGLRSIFALAGTVDGYSVDSRVLSYEGPFGVGYLVARVEAGEHDDSRTLSGWSVP